MFRIQEEQLKIAADMVMKSNSGVLLIAGYGSLPVRPEPGMVDIGQARILHMRKEMCIRVTRCRGTPERPGLVAGLVPAYGEHALASVSMIQGLPLEAALDQLSKRELQGLAYDPRPLQCVKDNGIEFLALAFVSALWHPDFVQFTARRSAEMILNAGGSCGENLHYLEMALTFERDTFGRVSSALSAIQEHIDATSMMAPCCAKP